MAYQSPDVTELLQISGETTLERATKKAQEQNARLFNVRLNIAVIGASGAGKSTFINAIRGLDDDDEGAAETGVVETTRVSTSYPHPQMPNVTYWDLPGTGTQNFKAKTYFKDVKFGIYDFFIIISSERFRENDVVLAKAIRKRKKLFYFVRSKIDQDIKAESKKKSFNRQQTLSKIRENCKKNLRDMGEPKIFLISSKRINDFDFQDLVDTLTSEIPEHKQSALLQSLPVSSMAILEKKIKSFKRQIWAAAAGSGVTAVIPIFGFSIACDAGILIAFFMRCYYAFGLDNKSIKQLTDRVNNPQLQSIRQSPLLNALASKTALKLELTALAGEAVIKYLCSLVPGAGSVAAAGISFGFTYKLLKDGLEELADAAREVLTVAGIQ